MRRLALGFDLDEFLNNMIWKLVPLYNAKYYDNLKYEEIAQYDIYPYLVPSCKHIFQEFCDDKFMLGLNVEHTAVETLTTLHPRHDLYFVTAGHPNTMEARDKWLAKHFPFYKSKMLIACTKKQLLDLDLLGDDFEQNLIGGAYVGVLMNKPWNLHVDEMQCGITRINAVSDILDIVARLERS